MTTKTTGQHTPTPWDLQTLRVSLVPVMIRVNGYTKETAEANAAFIVRACNNHDALVSFARKNADWLKKLIKQSEAQEKQNRGRFNSLADACLHDAKMYHVQLAEAEAAIASATGQGQHNHVNRKGNKGNNRRETT